MSARRKALVLALSSGLLVTMVTAYAFATHPRPQGATPDRDAFVVAYDPCTTPNTTHDGVYTAGSCDPPVKSSEWLQVGTFESNGAAAEFSGFVKNKVIIGDPTTPADEADVLLHAEIHDIRCTPALETSAPSKCDTTTPNAAAGPDYIGDVALVAGITLTDHRNDSADPGTVFDEAGSVVPLPVPPLPFPCTATADVTKGSDCSITVPLDLVAATLGVVLSEEGGRAVWRASSPVIVDGGSDGDTATGPNENFLVEGLFVP
jgi:hypothetical protein